MIIPISALILASFTLCGLLVFLFITFKKSYIFYHRCKNLDTIFKAFILSNKLEKNPSFFISHCYLIQADDYLLKCEASRDGFTYILVNKK